MHILRLTASLSVSLSTAIAPFWLPGTAFSQSTAPRPSASIASTFSRQISTGASTIPSPITIAQTTVQTTTNGQAAGTSLPSYTSPGTTLQSPGAGVSTPGITQSTSTTQQSPGVGLSTPGVTQTNGQGFGSGQLPSSDTGSTGTTQNSGQSVQTPGATTGTTGITQTPLSGQSTGTQTTPGSPGQTNSTSILNPPQLIQGSGVAAPTNQPATNQPATNTTSIPSQTAAPNTAAPNTATRTVAPRSASGSNQSPTQLQPGQGSLDTALQQATCAQNWQQAIRLVNTAIAATPANQAGSRSQLVSYRSRLQTLQAKGVQAPNWAQQCRGGSVANTPDSEER